MGSKKIQLLTMTHMPHHGTEARTAERPWEIQFLKAPASGQSKRNICLGQPMPGCCNWLRQWLVIAGGRKRLRVWRALIPSAGGVDNKPTIDTSWLGTALFPKMNDRSIGPMIGLIGEFAKKCTQKSMIDSWFPPIEILPFGCAL